MERAQLTDRLRAQGQELRRLLQRTEAVVAEYLDAEVELVSGGSESAGASRATTAILPKRILRKLGAANRVEAATIWLKAQPRTEP